MSARRHSTRLAMAVSSILAAPAVAAGFVLVAGLGFAPEVRAQETTAQLGGSVVDADGNPVAGATVTVLHVPSGTSRSAVTNASGQFVLTGLRVGGPYSVTAAASGSQGSMVENVYAELGRRANVSLVVAPTTVLAEVEVTAAGTAATAIGVGTEFTAETIASAPSINRDLKGTLRIDPKAWVDATNSDALEVAGVNNRYNSITVDGVRQSDDFGLNNNGYPTQRSPISLDAVEAVSLQTAPFDVQYSNFRGSTINVVTKSGTNEFDGAVYYYTYDDSLVGDKSKDRDFDFAFDEEKWGAALRGPILKDRLFFSLSYEKLDRKAPQDFGPTGSGAAIEVPGITRAEYDQIVQISRDVYDFDPGETLSSLPEEDEKIFAKIDWNITDNQRASFSYQRTEGNEVIQTNNSAQLPGPVDAVRLVQPRDHHGQLLAAVVRGLDRRVLDRGQGGPQGGRDAAGVTRRHGLRQLPHHHAQWRRGVRRAGRLPPGELPEQRPRHDQAEGQPVPGRPHGDLRLRARDARHLQRVRAAQHRRVLLQQHRQLRGAHRAAASTIRNAFTNDSERRCGGIRLRRRLVLRPGQLGGDVRVRADRWPALSIPTRRATSRCTTRTSRTATGSTTRRPWTAATC